LSHHDSIRFWKANKTPQSRNFNFPSFSNAFTNYLLPWLALAAQLPYETGRADLNLMALFMAIGSPALITFSLTLTILNRFWIRQRFQDLLRTAKSIESSGKYPDLSKRIESILYLLQEAQQDPIRASEHNHWLSSLLVLPKNQLWWQRLRQRLRRTRRGVTFSLIAQIVTAGIAWLIAVLSSFLESFGDTTTPLQMSSGSIWIWMVCCHILCILLLSGITLSSTATELHHSYPCPHLWTPLPSPRSISLGLPSARFANDPQIPVIVGWILVGTQSGHDAISEALNEDDAYRAADPPIDHDQEHGQLSRLDTTDTHQHGISITSGLVPLRHHSQSFDGGFNTPEAKYLNFPEWLGSDIRGDERHSGPLFNYARVFTWWRFSQTICDALEEMLQNIDAGRSCQRVESGKWDAFLELDDRQRQKRLKKWDFALGLDNITGDSAEIANYCGLGKGPLPPYPTFHEIPSAIWKRILVASILAIFVQWGTTGPAFFIAYLTPTQGFGCRSGSYLFYGAAGISVWFSLLVSMLLSHAAVLRYQTKQIKNPSIDLRPNTRSSNRYTRTLKHQLLCALAVSTRCFAKFLAIVNAAWLVISSLFEMIGAYDNCWCNACYLNYRENGWVVLFRNAEEIGQTVHTPLITGLATILLVCFFSWLFFYLGCKHPGGKGKE
jgi:hypothetical protein